MMAHDDCVESMELSMNEKLLFSGSLDMKVIIWSLDSYTQLCTLKTTFPVRSLHLSFENDYLIAISREENASKKIAFWPLEKNEGAFRINVPLKGISNCYVTPNNEYLAT